MARGARFSALVVLLLTLPCSAGAKCDPSTEPDRTDIATARAAVAAGCDCAGAASHGEYVRCSSDVLNTTLTNKSCKGAAQRCAARSTCGKPGFVTCCVTRAGVTKCKIRKDEAHCKAPRDGSACVGTATSCCDACPGGGCTTTTTAVTSTTTTTGQFTCQSSSDFPTCGGSCGAGTACQPERLVDGNGTRDFCACGVIGVCQSTMPFTCNVGSCAEGELCEFDTTADPTTCGCVPISSPSGAFLDPS